MEGLPHPPNAVSVDIVSTPELTLEWIQRLELLRIGPFNAFVSLQVITMAKEAFKAFQNGAKSPKQLPDIGPELASHSTLQSQQNSLDSLISHHFALLSIQGEPVAAGIFRPCGNFGAECVYIDLLVCNAPLKGYGAQLLHHIESYCVQKWVSALDRGIRVLSTERSAEFWRKCGYKGPEREDSSGGKMLVKNALLLRENVD